MNDLLYDAGQEYGGLTPVTNGHFDPSVFGVLFFILLLCFAGLMLQNQKRR
ncbi:hypothetical protein [Microcoleus sp. FACHB-672]|uniref:hypothetical protein n=1 Tax=Microcoleus sp. FACHB-672 TaxID=2692825 RepID=UPI00168430DE|nr:hypothetical protein [Microcoleus sp. FACHB-672]MBD2039304.1 hypothetical protein [Microcoleus sp. FACHB-672]